MPQAHTKVVLHPLVLLSVVDHYARVAKDTRKRVVGVLLGEVSKGVVDVTNSFAGAPAAACRPALLLRAVPNPRLPVPAAVPFEEDDHDPSIWFLDHSYLDQMGRMFKKVNGMSFAAYASP